MNLASASITFSAILCFTIALSSFPLQADVVYDNGAGGAAGIENAWNSDLDISSITAGSFSLVQDASINRITWSGAYGFDNTPGPTDDFTVRFYEDDGGLPALSNPIVEFPVGNAVNRTDSGTDIFGFDVYEYGAIVQFEAEASKTYWLSIFNNTVGEGDNFFWGGDSLGGTSAISNDSGASFGSADWKHDFRLHNVPEPTGLLLCSLLAIPISLARRRRICLVRVGLAPIQCVRM